MFFCNDTATTEIYTLALHDALPISGMLPFLSMRALEQIRTDVCYPNLPVKIIGTHGGLVGNGGATHHPVEDLAPLCAIPNKTVTPNRDPPPVRESPAHSIAQQGPNYI